MTKEKVIKELKKRVPKAARQFHPLYQFLKWEWVGRDNQRYIPTVKDLERNILSLLKTVEKGKVSCSECGGLEVRLWEEEKDYWSGSISFMNKVVV